MPDLLVYSRDRRVLVCAVQSPRHAARLAAIAPRARSGESLLFVGSPEALEGLASAGAWILPLERPNLTAIFAQLGAPLVEAEAPVRRSRRAA